MQQQQRGGARSPTLEGEGALQQFRISLEFNGTLSPPAMRYPSGTGNGGSSARAPSPSPALGVWGSLSAPGLGYAPSPVLGAGAPSPLMGRPAFSSAAFYSPTTRPLRFDSPASAGAAGVQPASLQPTPQPPLSRAASPDGGAADPGSDDVNAGSDDISAFSHSFSHLRGGRGAHWGDGGRETPGEEEHPTVFAYQPSQPQPAALGGGGLQWVGLSPRTAAKRAALGFRAKQLGHAAIAASRAVDDEEPTPRR